MNITKELESVIRAELDKRFLELCRPLDLPKPPAEIERATQRLKQAIGEYEAARAQLEKANLKHGWVTKRKQTHTWNGRQQISFYEATIPQFERGQLFSLPAEYYGNNQNASNWVAKNYAAIAVKLQYGKKVDVEAILREIRGLTL